MSPRGGCDPARRCAERGDRWARTLELTGGEHTATGAAALADIGLAPMNAVP